MDHEQSNKIIYSSIIEYIINQNNLDLLKLFIPKYYDINKIGANDNTSLTYAIPKGNERMVKYLIENGDNINQTNRIIS